MSEALLEQLQQINLKILELNKGIEDEEKDAVACEHKAREHRSSRAKLKDERAALQQVLENTKVKIHVENEATRATKAREEAEKTNAEVANLKAELEKKLAELEAPKPEQPVE